MQLYIIFVVIFTYNIHRDYFEPLHYYSHKIMQGGLLYIPPLPLNRMMMLCVIYNTLHISACNIFIQKEKYNE